MVQTEALLKALSQEEVQFIIIGGVAAILHGSAHLTYDLDICYSRNRDNLPRVVTALDRFHPRLRGKDLPPHLPFLFDTKTLAAGMNFTFTTDAGDIDLLGEVSGLGKYEDFIELSEVFDLYGIHCQVLSLAGLITAKKAASRNKDLLILPELEALLEMKGQKSNGDR